MKTVNYLSTSLYHLVMRLINNFILRTDW